MTNTQTTCPGCSGTGVLSDDPQILRCEGCGGFFTDPSEPITLEQAMRVVRLNAPMLANAYGDGAFYFDFDVRMAYDKNPSDARRMHGWADRKTRRVVQWG